MAVHPEFLTTMLTSPDDSSPRVPAKNANFMSIGVPASTRIRIGLNPEHLCSIHITVPVRYHAVHSRMRLTQVYGRRRAGATGPEFTYMAVARGSLLTPEEVSGQIVVSRRVSNGAVSDSTL